MESCGSDEDYLRRGLERASGGNNTRLLVIYCQADCWMSWNAAKRVLSTATPMWRGIRREPMVGSAPICRWRNRNRSREQMGSSSLRGSRNVRYSISCWIVRPSAKQPLVDRGGHLTDEFDHAPAVLEYPGFPDQLMPSSSILV